MKIQFVKFRNMLQVSPGLRLPMPKEHLDALRGEMTFTYITHNYNPAVRRAENLPPVEFEKRRLYKLDKYGQLITGFGYFDMLWEYFEKLGCQLEFIDKSPPRPRPKCYEADWEYMLERFELRSGQEDALVAIDSHFGGIIEAAPGFGKSYMFAALALLYRYAKIVIVIPEVDNVRKTVQHLTKYLPNVGQVGGGERRESRVTVYTAASFHHFEKDADFIFADEVHKLMANTYAEALTRLSQNTRNFGFTATPDGRKDNAHARMHCIFGRPIFRLGYEEAVADKLTVPIEVRWHNVRMNTNPCQNLDGVPRKRWGIWRNNTRNKIIAEIAKQYDDEQVLIMVATLEHAIYLKQLLPDYELCYANLDGRKRAQYQRQGFLPPDFESMTATKREAMRQAFGAGTLRKVIATDVWSTGVSFNALSVLIRADARASRILDTQIPGRVSRTDDGKEVGVIHDFFDQFDDGFKRAASSRRSNYKRNGWKQIDPPRVAVAK